MRGDWKAATGWASRKQSGCVCLLLILIGMRIDSKWRFWITFRMSPGIASSEGRMGNGDFLRGPELMTTFEQSQPPLLGQSIWGVSSPTSRGYLIPPELRLSLMTPSQHWELE